jgi:hypothetical protein
VLRKDGSMNADMPPARLRIAAVTLLLGACVAPSTSEQKPLPPPPKPTFSTLGLEGVMGRDARTLEREFGRADLDIHEGEARKLQFSSPICVLDAYLYPSGKGHEPVVTWVDARQPDGRDFDRASCVAALSRRQQAQ